KAPTIKGRGKLQSGTEWSVRPYPLCTHWLGRTLLSRFAYVWGLVRLRQRFVRLRKAAAMRSQGNRFRIDGLIVLNSRISCIHSSSVGRVRAPPAVERRSLAIAFVSARIINRR